jgi:GT2 family glycosyltransferase/glycosyltransferase involved in cell wall biosynthesis
MEYFMTNPRARRQVILILGMHRSGTSALTRVISLLGYGLPRNLIPASQHNVRGFWETQALVDFHDRVLQSAGSCWQDWSEFNPEWYASPLFHDANQELQAILQAEFGDRGPLVVKDPRICRLLPLWQAALHELQIDPTVLLPLRNPLEIARSLRQRDDFTEQTALLIWLRHVLDAEQTTRDLPRAFCAYETLLSDWRGTLAQIARHAGLIWPRRSLDSELEIDDFLSAEVRHHVISPAELTRPEIPRWIPDAYAALQQLIDDPHDEPAQRRLDAIHEEFDQASVLLGLATRAEEREAARYRQKTADLTTQLARLDSELTATRHWAETSDAALREQTAEAARLDRELEAAQRWAETSDATAARLDSALEAARHKSVLLATEIATLRNSLAWRITAPLRSVGTQVPALETCLRPVLEKTGALLSLEWLKTRRSSPVTPNEIARDVRSDFRALDPDHLPAPVDPYAAWLRVNQWNPRAEIALQERLAARRSQWLKISVVMPVYNPPLRFLTRAIQSLKRQVYPDWQLCIADDASTNSRVQPYLQELASDPRIVVTYREINGHISAATNSAAALATGDFLLLMDQDDELAIDALAEIALYLADHPNTDLLYSDSDKIDEHGQRYDPHFKPDWSPELLLSYMYAGQALVVRRSIFEQLGGLRLGFEGSQDHDLALRVGEVARQVGHLPYILYHWRCFRGSTAFSGHEKPYSFQAGLNAVQAALERRGSPGQAFQPDWAQRGGNGIYQIRFPDTGPSVTVIIPTHNRPDLLQRCLKSLRKTTYRDYRVMVVDNENHQRAARHYLDQLDHEVVPIPNRPGQGFSFSYIMNEAARRASTDYVLFLNDDTEVLTPEWLSSLVGHAELPGVGAVGALLRYQDGKVQHAGVVQGIDGLCDHAFKLTRRGDHGYLSYIAMTRNCAAVTAACLLTRRALFLEIGGFDEQRFPVAYNDPDYCYRLRERGYRIVYTPNAELLHHEGQTRGFSDRPQEIAAYRQAFKTVVDPYLNPNLSRENPCFTLTPRCLPREPRRPLRAALFTHNLNWEGAPKQLLEIAAFLHQHGAITPLIVSPTDGPLRRAYEEQGIEVQVWPHPLSRHAELPGYLEALGEIGVQLAEQAIDVVCANTLHGFFAVDAAREARLPCLWIIHESEGWRDYFDFVPPALRSRPLDCFRYPYRVIFVAQQTRTIYRDLDFYHQFTVIPNGMEPGSAPTPSQRQAARHTLGLDENAVGIVSVGTVCDRKRQIDLIEALARLDDSVFKNQPVRFFIVGDRENDYSRQMHERIATLPPARQGLLTVIPETPDVAVYYQAGDIFVLTSGMESYPRVILEAMAAGLAILATPVNGVVEQVRKGINADHFPVGDVAQLTARLTALIQDRSRREQYRVNSPLVLQGLADYAEMGASYATLFHEAALASVPDG